MQVIISEDNFQGLNSKLEPAASYTCFKCQMISTLFSIFAFRKTQVGYHVLTAIDDMETSWHLSTDNFPSSSSFVLHAVLQLAIPDFGLHRFSSERFNVTKVRITLWPIYGDLDDIQAFGNDGVRD